MEVKINQFQTPAPITFNYEELKAELQKKTDLYKKMVYTEDNIKQAKNDKALLNKTSEALDNERKRIEREYNEPFQDFKGKVAELKGMLDEASLAIKKQLDGFEDDRKKEKQKEIELHFSTMDKPEFLTLNQIWNPKWLNKTYEIATIRSELKSRIEQIQKDLATLSNLPEFGFEASKVYESTLDVNQALNRGKELAEIQKQKVEAEKVRKAQEKVEKIPEEEHGEEPGKDFMNPPVDHIPDATEKVCTDETIYPVSFRAYMTVEQTKEMMGWFKENGIKFETIQ